MLRRLAKTVLASGLRWSATDTWIGGLSGARSMPLIVAYHRVLEDVRTDTGSFLPGMAVSRATLERQLDWIGRHFGFVSLDELGASLEAGESFARPVAAVTFDDGYVDVYENALPLLVKKGIPAAVFVVTEFVRTRRPPLHDYLYLLLARAFATASAPDRLLRLVNRLSLPLSPAARRAFSSGPYPTLRFLFERLRQSELHGLACALVAEVGLDEVALSELRPLSWQALAKMRALGFAVGSHGKTHALLTRESAEDMRDETAGSRADLERYLGAPVKHFAYPDGEFDDDALDAVEAAGYRFAYTICPHREPSRPLLTIPRRTFWEGSCLDAFGRFSEPLMRCHVNGVFDLVARCSRNHALAA